MAIFLRLLGACNTAQFCSPGRAIKRVDSGTIRTSKLMLVPKDQNDQNMNNLKGLRFNWLTEIFYASSIAEAHSNMISHIVADLLL